MSEACRGAHMLFLDGVYIQPTEGKLRFRQIAPPTAEELQTLLHRITHRVAYKKVFTLQTLPPHATGNSRTRLATEAGFSVHAGVAARADQRDKLERPGGDPLCRYISRPAVSEKRLSLTANGQVRYQLKTPYRDGTTHVIFDRGGHPPNSAWRTVVTPAGRGRRLGMGQPEEADSTPEERRFSATWRNLEAPTSGQVAATRRSWISLPA